MKINNGNLTITKYKKFALYELWLNKGLELEVKRISSISWIVLQFLVLIIFTGGCSSIQKNKAPTKKEQINIESTIQETTKEENIKETIDLTKNSSWSIDKHNYYDHESFSELPKYDEKIDIDLIDIPFLQASIFYELNRRRTIVGLDVFKYSQALELAAMDHSRDMVRLDFYSHRSPVEGREYPNIRMARYGIQNAYIAEHINVGYGVVYQPGRPVFTPEQNESKFFSYELRGAPLPIQTYQTLSRSIVDSWMNTIPIRRNILNEKLIYTGIGVVHYKDTKFFGMDKFKVTQTLSSESGTIP